MYIKNKFSVKETLVVPLALILGVGGLSSVSHAAELEEIVVTATKRETSLMKTAVSVSAISQADLDAQGIQNVLDIGDLVPNMQISLSPEDSGVQIVIRGLTSNNFTELGDPTVALHFDGLYSPRPQAGLALMYDVERTEISRGPQGTIYGRNSTAGSINVISKRPQFDGQEGHAEVELGEYAQRVVKGWYNFPINDGLALRGSFLRSTADTWYNQSMDTFDLDWDTDGDGTTTGAFDVPADGIPNVDQRRNRPISDSDAYGAVDQYGARLSLRYEPNDTMSWDLITDYYKDRSPGGLRLKDCEKAEGTFFACDHGQWDVAVNVPGEMDMSIFGVRSILSWDLTDDVVLEHRIGYSRQQRSQLNDGSVNYADPEHPGFGITRRFYATSLPATCAWDTASGLLPDGAAGGMVDCGDLVRNLEVVQAVQGFESVVLQPFEDISFNTVYSDYKSMVTEIQLKSQNDESLQWLVGLFYMEEDNAIQFDVENAFCCGGVLPLAQSFVQPKRMVDSTAAFVQFDYAYSEALNFTAGFRYTKDSKEDVGGQNFVTTGYRYPNSGLYDPSASFWLESWTRIGLEPTASIDGGKGPYQSDVLTNDMGTLGAGFTDRILGTTNDYRGSWSKTTWRLGFDYLINEDVFLYGSLATGYKSGGFGDGVNICDCNDEDPGTTIKYFPYDPEENITLELGLKASMLDGDLRLLGNVFVTENTNLQDTYYAIVSFTGQEYGVSDNYQDPGVAADTCSSGEGLCVRVERDIGTLITQNIGETRNIGAELEFDWRPYDGGRVFGWVAWLDSQITELENSSDDWYCFERAYMGLTPCPDRVERLIDVGGGNQNLTAGRYKSFDGNAMPWSPEFSATLNFEHNWYLDNGLRVSPYLSVHWQDEMFFDKGNFDEGPFHSGQPAFATGDIALRLISEAGSWAIEAYVRNVTDELVRSWGDRGPGYMTGTFNKPRHVGLKYNRAF